MHRNLPLSSLLALALCAGVARADVPPAQDAPPPGLLQAILRHLGGGKPSPTRIAFQAPPSGGKTDDLCRMQQFDMLLTRGESVARKYSVMLDRQTADAPARPRQMLAVLTRVTVDADGSTRAYHPEDPEGGGTCTRVRTADGRETLEGVCALDKFSSGRIYVFRGPERLQKDQLVREWKDFWPLIRDRKLKSFELKDLAGPNVPEGYYLFYWKERNMTALFRNTIVPATRDGYPCVHGRESRFPGYFVAATTLNQNGGARNDGCTPARFIDAEQIPFFVLPHGGFGDVGIGDIVVARLKRDGADRVVYGVIADAGPPTQLGEGSIALNASLLGKRGDTVMNVRDVDALDIDGPAVSVLVLGGTRDMLKGDYSRRNIEAIGRREFWHWSGADGDPLRRLDACMAQAVVNRK
jgi:hypothetical protein